MQREVTMTDRTSEFPAKQIAGIALLGIEPPQRGLIVY